VNAFIDFLKGMMRPSSPLVIVAAFGAAGLWIHLRPSSAQARRFLYVLVLGFWLLSTRAGVELLVAGIGHGFRPIETREDARGADVVVVLSGGGESYREAGVVVAFPSRTTILRALEGARVFRAIGARLVVASGGIVYPEINLRPESEMLRETLMKAGVPEARIVEENGSRTTRDQARLVAAMLAREGTRKVVLVTSPTHLPRSMAVFRAAGLDPVPAAAPLVSDQMPPLSWVIPNYGALYLSDAAVYDYAATIYYWLTGAARVTSSTAAP
jgi:uncharacterized SAM-binding protein YcdF (DUF218 family)